jgi:hypothetical protein
MQWSRGWAALVWSLLEFDINNNPLQAEAIYKVLDGARFLLICGGERSGKSFLTVAIALLLIQPQDPDNLDQCPPTLVWVVGPDYLQARAEFEYLYYTLERGGFIKSVSMPNSQTSSWNLTTTWNCTITTKSSGDIRKLASFAPDVFIMSEAAQQEYGVYLKARGRVAQKRGHILLSGTLEQGLPWYGDLLKRWRGRNAEGGHAVSIPTWTNKKEFPGGWHDPEIVGLRESVHEDYFMERYGAEPRKATNLVIPEFDYTQHVKELKPEPDAPVELWIDPGKNAYAVLFVQTLGKTTHVLDRVYRRGVIAQDVIPEVKDNPLWELVMKNTQSHGVIDIAGRQQHGAPSQIEIWQDAGVQLRSNYVHQDIGRDVVRYRLRPLGKDEAPLLFFNSHMTNRMSPDGTAEDVFAEFELWKWRTRHHNSSEPRHPIDANNHAIKALGYGLYDKFGPIEERRPLGKRKQRAYWSTL